MKWILQDLQGPKIRLGALKDNRLDLKKGDEVVLESQEFEHDGGLTVPVQYNLERNAEWESRSRCLMGR